MQIFKEVLKYLKKFRLLHHLLAQISIIFARLCTILEMIRYEYDPGRFTIDFYHNEKIKLI